jgi:hypothetical protein
MSSNESMVAKLQESERRRNVFERKAGEVTSDLPILGSVHYFDLQSLVLRSPYRIWNIAAQIELALDQIGSNGPTSIYSLGSWKIHRQI